MAKTLKIYSTRFTPAKGNHFQVERECQASDVQAWLKIFREDEPKVCFVASTTKPKGGR